MSKAHQAHFRGDAVWCGADEEEPLGQEVRNEDQVAAVRDRFHKHVPCDDEVGEDEEHGSECEQTAPLQQGAKHHYADQACVYSYADADDPGFCCWDYAEKHYSQKRQCAEHDHGKIALHLHGKFPVSFDLCEVSAGEIDDVHDVCEREGTHLSEEAP